ncbi:uncharacterized protein LOC131332354 [Rhododendron vialii]|uniref:uncharacterized protein LOC131332354 n=1 Tax=Rhododendron vialii TaxID=182163 RepID=UPI00265D9FC2|nr:uncharacterized protein LOC131332354 [Rhododendron vialii]
MPPRRRRTVEDVTLHDELAELRQSNQTLQHMMNEILQRMQTFPWRSRRSHSRISGSQSDMDEGSDSFSSKENSEAAFGDRWAMERLTRALKGTDRSIQVHVPDFEGKLDPEQYCDWVASLEAFFEWKNMTEERKVQFVATKLKGHALVWWQQYQRSRDRRGVPRVGTWAEMKLKLDEKFLPLDYSHSLYQKFHRLRHHNEQSVADYTKQFYKLWSRINLMETDDQLVARYTSGLKLNLQGELMMHPIHSLEEAYQMALKAEEKVKWAPFGKGDTSKALKGKTVTQNKKNSAPNSEHPNPHAGGGKKDFGKAESSSSSKCFRCGEAGHRAYECPTKKAEVNFVQEGQEEEEEPIYDEEPEGGIEREYCEPEYDAQSLVIQQVMTVQENDKWLKHNIFRTYCLANGKKCILMVDSGSVENMVSKTMVGKLKLACE